MLQRSVFLHYSVVDKLQILFLDYDLNYGFYKTDIGQYGIICNWGYTIRKKVVRMPELSRIFVIDFKKVNSNDYG